MSNRSAEDWAGIIAGLTLDLDKATGALAVLDAERQPLPLAAATGDAAAGKALVVIDRRRGELRQQIDLLGDGLVDARTRHAAAVAAEAADRAAGRLDEARRIAGEIVRVDRDIDRAMQDMAQAFQAREDLMRALAGVGQLDHGRLNKLRNKTMRLAAVHANGLATFLPVDRVQAHHHTSLAGWDARFLAGLLPPAANLPPAPEPPPPPPPSPAPDAGDDWDEKAADKWLAREFAV